LSTASLRELVERLGASSRALAALGAAVQARAAATPLDPAIRARVDEVLDALGARRLVEQNDPAELRPVLGAIRTELFLGARLVSGTPPGAAWSDTDPAALQAAGDVSVGFPGTLKRTVAPQLDGLPERLAAADASFLDVGVGVAAMAVEMVRQWPSLRVVGVDPWAPSIAIARENVRAAGLAARIELREQGAEALADENRFDLAWVPSVFIPERALPSILERVARALRPGGWLLLAFANPSGDPLAAALTRLRTALWGGAQLAPPEVERLLARSGLMDVKALPSPPNATIAMARDTVRTAGLADRIELREQGAEDLADEGRFDLAWVPSVFIPGQALSAVLERVARALRPGGWLLLAFANPGSDPLAAALTRLRTVLWGGADTSSDEVEESLARAGFAEVKALPGPPNSAVAAVAGRRPRAGIDAGS